MLLIDKIRKDFILYILTIFTAITILTLSSTPENLLDNNLIKNNLYENIIFFKSTFPIIIFITLVFITIKKFREFQFIKRNFRNPKPNHSTTKHWRRRRERQFISTSNLSFIKRK